MKNETFYDKLYDIGIFILLFSAFILIPLKSFSMEKKEKVLENVKQLIVRENKDTGQIHALTLQIDSLINHSVISDKAFVQMINRIGEIFREQGKITFAVELYLNAVSYYEQRSNLSVSEIASLVQFYIPLGASHEELGMWNRAMEFYHKALKLAEEYNLDASKAMIYNNIGAIYYNRSELDKAEKYVLKALAINKKTKAIKELFNNYNNLGGIYLQRNKQDKALDYALKAIQLLDSEKNAYLYYFMQSNIASLYLLKKDYALALSYLRNAMQHQEEYGFDSDLIQTYSLAAEVFAGIGKRDSSLIYLKKALIRSQNLNNKHVESSIQQKMAAFFQQSGDYGKAYDALSEYVYLNDSISQIDNRKRVNDMEKIYDADKKARENELLIKDMALQKATSDRLWVITASLAIFLIGAILFLINRSRNKEKERKAQELLAEQQKVLYEKEKELQKQKEQELNYTLDQRNRELTSYTLYMVKTNEFISDINEELKRLLLELNPKDREHKMHLQKILNKLQQQNTNNNWNEFRYYFEQVHPSFYENLEKKYPDLTIKEQRLCAFLRLGLSSKDISAITFKEVRSVESARNRLRKKLGITPDGNLTEFLSQNLS